MSTRIEGIVDKVSDAEHFSTVEWVLKKGYMVNFAQAKVTEKLKANVDFQGRAGLKTTVTRYSTDGCCDWCKRRMGTYDYNDTPEGFWHRHVDCNCIIKYSPAGSKTTYLTGRKDPLADPKKWYKVDDETLRARKLFNISNGEQTRRKIGKRGKEVCDQPTFNKLTEKFRKRGGIIIRGERAEEHLNTNGADASYVGGVAFLRDDATISEVLEEMYHAEQDRKNTFGDIGNVEARIRREIQAQEYLINVAERYKIPIEEQEQTKLALENYKKELEWYLNNEK